MSIDEEICISDNEFEDIRKIVKHYFIKCGKRKESEIRYKLNLFLVKIANNMAWPDVCKDRRKWFTLKNSIYRWEKTGFISEVLDIISRHRNLL
jgi:hypothetical protein